MNKAVWINIWLAMLVAGIFMTASCAKQPVTVEPTSSFEDENNAEAERAQALQAEEEMKSRALMEQESAAMLAAKERFLNQNINFEYDSSELTETAKAILKEKADWLTQNPDIMVTVEGHCDNRGTIEYNLGLGEKRAITVKKYLIDLGIDTSRLDTVSYGEERPLDTANIEEAWSKNRRAQFVLK